jgi:heme A synthase
LVLLAGLIIDANLVRRAPTQASLTAVKWILGGAVALLVVGPVLGEVFLSDQLHRAGYAPCGTDWHPLHFARTEWVLPDQPCTPQADR